MVAVSIAHMVTERSEINSPGVPLRVRNKEKSGRKVEEIRLHSPHRKCNNCCPEVSAATFLLWVTHESGRYPCLDPNPEELPSHSLAATKISILCPPVFSLSQR
jgi:hypothetical protein